MPRVVAHESEDSGTVIDTELSKQEDSGVCSYCYCEEGDREYK